MIKSKLIFISSGKIMDTSSPTDDGNKSATASVIAQPLKTNGDNKVEEGHQQHIADSPIKVFYL